MTQKCAKNLTVLCLVRTLQCGPISHIGVYPRMSEAEPELLHNSGEVGGGWRTLRIITSEAERRLHSEECDAGYDV